MLTMAAAAAEAAIGPRDLPRRAVVYLVGCLCFGWLFGWLLLFVVMIVGYCALVAAVCCDDC